MSGVFEYIRDDGYEQIVFCSDDQSGLRAIIAIHSTAMGPALGGTRFYPYENEEAAIVDVLRLAQGMTYKAAAAGLDLGGGKAVIIGDPATDKSEALLRAYGRFVQSLNGRYYTACDVGTNSLDKDDIARMLTPQIELPAFQRDAAHWIRHLTRAEDDLLDACAAVTGGTADLRWTAPEPILEAGIAVGQQGQAEAGGEHHDRDERYRGHRDLAGGSHHARPDPQREQRRAGPDVDRREGDRRLEADALEPDLHIRNCIRIRSCTRATTRRTSRPRPRRPPAPRTPRCGRWWWASCASRSTRRSRPLPPFGCPPPALAWPP